MAYKAFPSVDVAVDVAYHTYPYRGGNIQIASPQVVGWRTDVSGRPSHVLEASVALRVTASVSPVNPFVTLTGGVLRIKVGEVNVSSGLGMDPQNVSRTLYQGTGSSETRPFGALGFGFSLPLGSNIRIMMESRFVRAFGGDEAFIPVLSTVQFCL